MWAGEARLAPFRPRCQDGNPAKAVETTLRGFAAKRLAE